MIVYCIVGVRSSIWSILQQKSVQLQNLQLVHEWLYNDNITNSPEKSNKTSLKSVSKGLNVIADIFFCEPTSTVYMHSGSVAPLISWITSNSRY